MKITKGKFALFLIMTIIFTAFSIFALVYYYSETYSSFFNTAKTEFEIPGLEEGFVPQGMEYEKVNDIFLVSGYMANGSASRLYIIDNENEVKYVTFTFENKPYKEHAGGVTSDGYGLWIVGDSTVNYLHLSELLNAQNGDELSIMSSFSAPNGADFVTIYDGKLIVGEFHREGNYNRDSSHEIITSSGKVNKAVSFAYEIDNNGDCGLRTLNPIFAISTTSLVQGMSITEDKIILSTSYSLPSSQILVYDNILNETATKMNYTGLEEEIDTYILDTPTSSKTLPPMSEEITVKDNSLYILFENACSKYKMWTRLNLTNVYSYNLENL